MENAIMKLLALAAFGLILVSNIASPAAAQVTIDVSKITCDQFSGYKVTSPDNIAIWLNGYHSGKRDSTIVDTQNLQENVKKLITYCIRNPKIPVMQAAETVLGDKK
jgi:acid stress chaperone HdeB